MFLLCSIRRSHNRWVSSCDVGVGTAGRADRLHGGACGRATPFKEWQMEYLIYWLFFELIGCRIAQLAIPVLSFGCAYVQPITTPAAGFNWLGWRQDDGGRMVVARDVADFIG